jgi:processive 1,2-diacylglycerol beta-glucosyltransferase
MTSPRILVLSASVGGGHVSAAKAVTLALQQTAPDATVLNVDVLEKCTRAFRRIYGRTYLDLVNSAPHLLGYFYDAMDRPRRPGDLRERMRLLFERMNLGRFMRLLQNEGPWDLAVCTHFLPAEIIAWLRRSQRSSLKQMTVTTDFETHRLWVNQPCDRYTTATQEGKLYLQRWGVPEDAVRVTGIPVNPVFAQPKDRDECRARMGVTGGRPVILHLAGGFGVGPVREQYQALLSMERPVEVVVVAGKNPKVKADLLRASVPERHRVQVLGFTDKMDELMAAADVVVSKPGGLTTSEALARGAAMVIVSPIPGQEGRNSDYLLESGAAIKVNNTATLAYKLEALLDDPERLQSLRDNARRIARPRAAFDVAEEALGMIAR